MSFKVLICGTRTWDEWRPIRQYVDSLPEGTVVIEGEARGADSIARACAMQRGLEVLPFPADWKQHGKAAGHIRNARMLAEGRPDRVVAFAHNLATSKGTQDMIARARAAGIPVQLFPPRDPRGQESAT